MTSKRSIVVVVVVDVNVVVVVAAAAAAAAAAAVSVAVVAFQKSFNVLDAAYCSSIVFAPYNILLFQRPSIGLFLAGLV